MLYQFTRKIVKLSLFVFFKRIVVSGTDLIPDEGPLLIVANHPNTLMDPLIVASVTKRRIGFVANAGIYSIKIMNAVFNYFHVIPIYRKKDVKPGEKPDNNATFIKCHEYLAQNGALLIFPEGSSYHELKLREIKTGTARIALSYEALHQFNGNLKILPVALDYSDSLQFRSMVSVIINPPISTYTYRELYNNNEFEAINKLTEEIRRSLAKNIPHTTDKDQEDFLIKAHKFYTTYCDPDADLYENPARSLQVRSQLSEALRTVEVNNYQLYNSISEKTTAYFNLLRQSGVTAGFFTDHFRKKSKWIVLTGYLIIFVLLFPVYIFGVAVNYIPYILPSKIFQILKTDIEYKTSVQLVAGLITFPLFYTLEILLIRKFICPEPFYVFTILLLFPITGYMAMYYFTEAKRFMRVIKYYFVIKENQKNEILNIRNRLLEMIDEARKYLIK